MQATQAYITNCSFTDATSGATAVRLVGNHVARINGSTFSNLRGALRPGWVGSRQEGCAVTWLGWEEAGGVRCDLAGLGAGRKAGSRKAPPTHLVRTRLRVKASIPFGFGGGAR